LGEWDKQQLRQAVISRETFAGKSRFGDRCRSGDDRHAVAVMAEYRLYCLDGSSKVASGDWIEADDDQAAILVAKATHDGFECELWQGKRLVACLDLRRQA
jgi:hypothetical protein